MEEIRINRSGHVDSLHIERAKNYIRNHRNQNLTVSLVAHEIGISTSYLSSLFRQFEECSVKRFILQTKLEGAAKNVAYGTPGARNIKKERTLFGLYFTG